MLAPACQVFIFPVVATMIRRPPLRWDLPNSTVGDTGQVVTEWLYGRAPRSRTEFHDYPRDKSDLHRRTSGRGKVLPYDTYESEVLITGFPYSTKASGPLQSTPMVNGVFVLTNLTSNGRPVYGNRDHPIPIFLSWEDSDHGLTVPGWMLGYNNPLPTALQC